MIIALTLKFACVAGYHVLGDPGNLYREFGTWSGIVIYREDARERLSSADGLIMDCDGTMVDVRRSYLMAAVESARLLAARSGHGLPPASALRSIIPALKESGILNNDWDTAAALYIAWSRHVDEGVPLESAASELASSRDLEELYGLAPTASREFLEGCPGPPPGCEISSIFDSLYYGRAAYEEIYGVDPPLPVSRGMLEDESLSTGPVELRALGVRMRGALGMVTGRPRRAMRGPLVELIGSVIRADHVIITGELGAPKPDPRPLLEAAYRLGSSRPIYVGDSAEDFIMAEASRAAGLDTMFVGVYGLSLDAGRSTRWFASRGVPALIPSLGPLHLLLDI